MIKCVLTAIIVTVTSALSAQTPQDIPYQAIARNKSGGIIANHTISVRFTIHDSSTSGPTVYRETFSPMTNAFGLFNVNVGNGSATVGTFNNINWGRNAKFMQVELDAAGGTSYVDMGTTQMMSVPYALYSEKSREAYGYNFLGKFCGTAGGSANTIVLSPTIPVPSLDTGLTLSFLASANNTGSVTLNISGLGVKNMTKNGAAPLISGDIISGNIYAAQYDGTRFQLINYSNFLQTNNNLSDLTNPSTARTNLGLGTAATENTGTSANNIVKLDGSGRLPAVDGSQLTGVSGSGIFTTSYTSVDQSITFGSPVTLAHGFSGVPKIVNIYLICQTSELGYSAGDIVQVSPATDADYTYADYGMVLSINTAYINYRIVPNGFTIGLKTSGANSRITAAYWKIRVIAYY